MAGYVDIFRKLWGWLSGETAVVVPGPKVIDRVNFDNPDDRVNFKTPKDRVDFLDY